MSNTNYPSEKRLKQLVKQFKKEKQVKTHQAYQLISRSFGYSSWQELKPILELHWKTQILDGNRGVRLVWDDLDIEVWLSFDLFRVCDGLVADFVQRI